MIRTLRGEVDSLAPASAAAVVSGVVNVLVASLRSPSACSKTALSSMAAYHVVYGRARIDDRLHDPALTIESIAIDLCMSIGHLHRLFELELLSPSHYPRNRRLGASGRELVDPRRAVASAAEIAFGWGCNNVSCFTPVFRGRFHCSPREWRRQSGDAAPSGM